MPTLSDWYHGLPKVTRAYLTCAFGATVLFMAGMLNPATIAWSWPMFFNKFQVWRFATNFVFFGKFSMGFVFSLYILYQYSSALETSSFAGRMADYLWFLIFNATCSIAFLMVVGWPYPFLGHAMIFAIMHVWARQNPTKEMSIMGLFTVQAAYFPFVMVALSMMMGSDVTLDLLGIGIGHVYHFVQDLYPATSGKGYLNAPRLFRQMVGEEQRAPQTGVFGQHQWGGGGRALGR